MVTAVLCQSIWQGGTQSKWHSHPAPPSERPLPHMTVQINQDPRQTFTLHTTKEFSPTLYGFTRQLNYTCNSMCMHTYAAMSTVTSLDINFYSCIKHKPISGPNVYLHANECLLCKSVCVCTCMWREVCFVWKGGTEGRRNQLCAGCLLWGVAGWGCEDMSALCVGTPHSSLLIHCSPAPTNR